MINIDV